MERIGQNSCALLLLIMVTASPFVLVLVLAMIAALTR
jgi:hypothetical protein